MECFMNRRKIREQIFLLLFSVEFFPKEERMAQMTFALSELKEMQEEDASYIETKLRNICSRIEEIDDAINARTENWKTSRMAKTDLSILRLAVYEMKYEEEIPVPVAINEAVELAKVYGDEKSPSFVNGVLAKLV